MKITALLENTCGHPSVRTEHGLSLFIETGKFNILFDTGQTSMFYDNAVKLGISLEKVDFAVLSHGHYDHGGGLHKFLEINKTAPVYLSRYAFGDYYNGTQKYIGLDKALQSEPRFIYTDDYFRVQDGIELFSCNDKEPVFPVNAYGLNKKTGNKFLPDDFIHEQYLKINENGKDILISGCSHKGILNIEEWFKPRILVGGFHFKKLNPQNEQDRSALKDAAVKLSSYNTDYYTCHCTGTEQYEYLKNCMPKLNYLSCGQTIVI